MGQSAACGSSAAWGQPLARLQQCERSLLRARRPEFSRELVGTVKGRVGLTMPSMLPTVQELLAYVRGGLAYAQVERQTRVTLLGVGPQAARDG